MSLVSGTRGIARFTKRQAPELLGCGEIALNEWLDTGRLELAGAAAGIARSSVYAMQLELGHAVGRWAGPTVAVEEVQRVLGIGRSEFNRLVDAGDLRVWTGPGGGVVCCGCRSSAF